MRMSSVQFTEDLFKTQFYGFGGGMGQCDAATSFASFAGTVADRQKCTRRGNHGV